jgi:type IV pilus assembly protein PilW
MMLFQKNVRSIRQYGFGLIEVMIAMAIGLILIGALAYFFLGSRQMNRSHDNISRMQESGRNALESLGRPIRQAGYISDATLIAGVPVNLLSFDAVQGASADLPDSITVRYQAADGGAVDCTGANIGGGATITEVYAVNLATTPPALTCNGGAIVDNIENMKISYGIDDTRDGTIERYTQTPNPGDLASAAAIRISLLVRGPETRAAVNNSQSYTYNGVAATKTDGFLRQVYTSTFVVRGQAR